MNPLLTRRQLVQRGAAGATMLSLPGLLAACGGDDGGGGSSDVLKDVLNFANWPLYIDLDAKTKKSPTLEEFTKQSGIKVNYFTEIDDNADYFATVQGRLSQGQGIDRDIFVFTDNSRFPGLLVDQGWVQKLDKDRIPNMANLIEAQASPSFDPNRDYSLPWFSGMTGIAWNTEVTEQVTTMQQFFEDPKLKGKITMLKELADSVGVTMLGNGDDPSSVTDESFDKAIQTIQGAVDAGQIRAFMGNEYAVPLAKGDLAAAVAWSGDVIQLLADNPQLRWDIPETGGMIWTDNMFIPTGGSVPTASTYMNFVYDPAIAAQLSLGATYISSVKGVKEAATTIDSKSAANPLIFPTDELLSNLHQYDSKALNNDEQITAWQKVLGQ